MSNDIFDQLAELQRLTKIQADLRYALEQQFAVDKNRRRATPKVDLYLENRTIEIRPVDDEINIADLVTGLDELRIPPGSVKVACRGYGEDSYLAVTISL